MAPNPPLRAPQWNLYIRRANYHIREKAICRIFENIWRAHLKTSFNGFGPTALDRESDLPTAIADSISSIFAVSEEVRPANADSVLVGTIRKAYDFACESSGWDMRNMVL